MNSVLYVYLQQISAIRFWMQTIYNGAVCLNLMNEKLIYLKWVFVHSSGSAESESEIGGLNRTKYSDQTWKSILDKSVQIPMELSGLRLGVPILRYETARTKKVRDLRDSDSNDSERAIDRAQSRPLMYTLYTRGCRRPNLTSFKSDFCNFGLGISSNRSKTWSTCEC